MYSALSGSVESMLLTINLSKESTMKVIIAGSRSIKDLNHVIDACEASGFDITHVIEGGAKGVDRLGRQYAQMNLIPFTTMNADWKDLTVPNCLVRQNRYGKYNALAGHNRNGDMAKVAEALIAVWDGKSTGTRDMINRMKAPSMDKPVFIWDITKNNKQAKMF
jgi:hypothetical protein